MSQYHDSLPSLESVFFRTLLEKLEVPVFVKNDRHQWVFTNEAFENLVGCSDLIGKTDSDLLPEDQVEKFYEGDDRVIRTQKSFTQEEAIGEGCYALVKKIPIALPGGGDGILGIIFDISDYRRVQLEVEKLRLAKKQSHTDPLTGVANRRHLDEHYHRVAEQCRSTKENVSLLHIDLDHFKEINDTKGHLLGDAVLIHIADILRECTEHSDFIARIGGDEFVVVVAGKNDSELEMIAERIVVAAGKSVLLDSENCTPAVSIGIATATDANLSLNQILKRADLALYRAKHKGRGRYEQFSVSIQQEYTAHRRRREELRIALEENQFLPYYQAQFDTETLQIIGVEALARWHHPERGILSPNEFLELATSEHRIADLDQAILRKAIEDMKGLIASGACMPALSINVSCESLTRPDFVDQIKGMRPFPNHLCIELLESMLLDKPSSVVSKNLTLIREMGISLEIDDFGSGHTSLLGMLEAKPARVKIDKGLVIPMTQSPQHYNLVKAVIQIADSMGIDTLAEGVESESHRQMLLTLGCKSIQGFGFSKPLPLHELKHLLSNQKAA